MANAASRRHPTADDPGTQSQGGITAIALLVAAACIAGLVFLPRLGRSNNRMSGPAPEFALPVVFNGEPSARISLADLKGKPVIVDFWATWCGPCAMQAPILDRVAKRYSKQGLVVLGVNVDDDASVARNYAARKGLSYPILFDESSKVQRLYGVNKLPSLIVVDKSGNVRSVTQGLVDEATLDNIVREAL